MANIIFSPELASVIILPLMVFHQTQLLACSYISRKLAYAGKRRENEALAANGKVV